ncbi:MAG: Rrf2 family transcriptional regulator [Candidatus Glassbacteria bacterium]|nr:Rrf2 family transcriptional regulator [Candidatus Glassbacteria bacterium]
MLNKTTQIGIKTLIFLGLYGGNDPVSPRRIAGHLGISPTYLSKITALLVKADILVSHRGVLGGVTFSRPTSSFTLLEIIEACQGRVTGDYCQRSEDIDKVCAFHRAMQEVHQETVEVLSRWSLADLIAKPAPDEDVQSRVTCMMADIKPSVGELAATK